MSDRFRLFVPSHFLEAIIAHARRELPAECCGLLVGTIDNGIGRSLAHFPLVNALSSPTEFESEPRSMLAAHKAMRLSAHRILAIYHSHPTSEPIPSRRDMERNYGEEVVNLIIGLKGPEPVVRGWWLSTLDFREAEWAVE